GSSDISIDQIKLSVYPNPADNTLKISLNSIDFEDNQLNISIFDVTGKLVYNDKMELNYGQVEKLINTDYLYPGVYHLKISSSQKSFTKRIIIN
ncbi:T9SS type A sorting domain-containing protein, partial [bacterium AH-315-C07]|nr:T9SS type A sorting domain-containing protein [bacterium AH-315-C07]